MIAAFDVHYLDHGCAAAAAVLFIDYGDAVAARRYTRIVHGVPDYVRGQFFRRELPCLLELIADIEESLDTMIVDGYVMHGDGPGLGHHLYRAFGGKIPVIGVAKSKYANAPGIEILRGRSQRPLYVTAAGLDRRDAGERIRQMHGRHRIPTLLKQADHLARETARKFIANSNGGGCGFSERESV